MQSSSLTSSHGRSCTPFISNKDLSTTTTRRTTSLNPSPLLHLTWTKSHKTNPLPPLLYANSSNTLSANANCSIKSLRGWIKSPSPSISTPPPQLKLTFHSQFNLTWTKSHKKTLSPLLCGNSSNAVSANGSSGSIRGWIESAGEAVSTAFPIWVALGCLMGLVKPSSFNWVQPKWTIMGITITMLGMGMTLTLDDLRGALAMPKELLAGFVLQYSVCSSFSQILVGQNGN